MKSILLFVCLFCFSYSFGQQKLLSMVSHHYQPDSSLFHKDSVSFIYYAWQGSIEHLKPSFELGEHSLSWEFPNIEIPCDEEERYNFNPFNLVNFKEKVSYNGLVIESNDQSYRVLNFYDANDNLKQRLTQQNIGGTFQTQDSTVWSYDNLNNLVYVVGFYNNFGTMTVYSAISNEYVPGTNLINEITFLIQPSVGSTLVPNLRLVVTYIGNEIDYIDRFDFGPPNYNPNWSARKIYTYAAGNISNWKHFGISNGQIASTSSLEYDYVYDTQNQLLEAQISGNGTILKKEQYQYDSPGFISKFTRFDIDSNNSLFKQIERDFTYKNTLGMDEIENVDVQIYPNPTSDNLTIQTDGEIKFVQVLNLAGQVLIEQNLGEVDVRHLSAGTYVIKGTTSEGNFSTKIIKK